ncbi:MAG: hypothetical protein G01um101472_416 [Parcubacteria group bacterium Gr01-1014_72]|nr:MAG: hypothetical protein G01um101472_416 [Parcubacteria group bacterium Gr01-1014_72]
MSWTLAVDSAANKQWRRFPHKDRERIRLALHEVEGNPFGGDLQKIKGEDFVWRRRVGSYRIKYELRVSEKLVYVFDIKRRGSHTY